MFDSLCHGSGGRPHQRSLCPGTGQEAGGANVVRREAVTAASPLIALPSAAVGQERTHTREPAAGSATMLPTAPAPPGQHSPSSLPHAAPQPEPRSLLSTTGTFLGHRDMVLEGYDVASVSHCMKQG